MGAALKTSLRGASEDRTRDLYHAMVALSQLSYGPRKKPGVLSRDRSREPGRPGD